MNKKSLIMCVIAILFLLILIFGAAYSYFQIVVKNNTISTNLEGSTNVMPKSTLITNVSILKLNISATMMHENNSGTIYYATEDGTPVTNATIGSGKYILATASLNASGLSYDCIYTYSISATSAKSIADGSDANVKVRITGSDGYTETYTLAQLLSGNQTYTGKIKELVYGENQNIYIEAYLENTNKVQNDLSGNSFTFQVSLVNDSFSCGLAKYVFAKELVN